MKIIIAVDVVVIIIIWKYLIIAQTYPALCLKSYRYVNGTREYMNILRHSLHHEKVSWKCDQLRKNRKKKLCHVTSSIHAHMHLPHYVCVHVYVAED